MPDGRWLLVGGEGEAGVTGSAEIKDSRSGATTPLAARLREPRTGHSATLLPDGTVLIFGGVNSAGKILDSAELFNPDTQTFATRGALGLLPRAYHSATLLTDGRVLVVGGLDAKGRAQSNVELWDSATGKRSGLGPKLTGPRLKHTARLLSDGTVLLEGGVGRNGNPVTAGEQYDPERQRSGWSTDWVEEGGTPSLAASIPKDGEQDVLPGARIALRFSQPLAVTTVNSGTVKLTSTEGDATARVTPAEGGRLAFIIPDEALRPATVYTVTLNGPANAASVPLPYSAFSFTTADARSDKVDGSDKASSTRPCQDEEWRPDVGNPQGDWKYNCPESPLTKLPPLQAAKGVTALAGQVLNLNGLPLPNVTLSLGVVAVRTDASGRFLLSQLAAGRGNLIIDGLSAGPPGKLYGTFEVLVEVKEGQTNVLPYTIWLPLIDTQNATRLPAPTKSKLTARTPRVPGLEVTIAADTVLRFPAGGHQHGGMKHSSAVMDVLTITPIPVNRSPFPLPAGGGPDGVLFSLQMHGARSEGPNGEKRPGIQITYPNSARLPAGSRYDFWNYEAGKGGWYFYGQGTVSEDGRRVVPDPGVELESMHCLSFGNPSLAPATGPTPGNPEGTDGDPVDLATGLFVYEKTDLALRDVTPLAVRRTYRQNDTASRAFGIGTSLPYDLYLVGQQFTYVELILPDGGRIHYDRISPGTGGADGVFEHTSTPTQFFKSRVTFDGVNRKWRLQLLDGTAYLFSLVGPRLDMIIDRHGNKVTLTRDGSRNVSRITSAQGRWIEFTYDGINRITAARDNTGRVVTYTYDETGRLAKVTDPQGGTTEYTYDSAHRMLTIKDARGIVFLTNEYDAQGRVVKQTQADATAYQFAYTEADGKVVQTDVTDPRGNLRRVTFNSSGYILKDTRAVGKPEQQAVTYERQAGTNLPLSMTDALSRKTAYTYDAQGNVKSITRLPGTTSAVTTTFTYEPAFNQVESVTDPLGHSIRMTYDEAGSLTKVRDSLNRETTFTYNAAGQPVAVTDPLGYTVRLTYDTGDLVAVTDPLGNTTNMIVDRAGRMVSSTDPLGRLTVFQYDALNQLVKVTGPQGEEVSTTYDANGNRMSVKDPRGNVTRYAYDNMDRLISRTDPLLKAESYVYNEAGDLTKFTDRRGKITTFKYDNLDRLTFTGFGWTAGDHFESSVSRTYDAADRLTKTVDSQAGTDTFVYDKLDRLTSAATPRGTVTYVYDKAARRTRMTVAGQSAVNYAYDAADRLTRITQGTSVIAFGYDDADRRTSLTLPNGVAITYNYDSASRVTGIEYEKGGVALGDLTYGYDATGKRVKVGGSFARTNLPQTVTSLPYNAANRLTKWGAKALTYDANGNLLGDGVNSYTWDARNRLASISGPGLSASFVYDSSGRRVRKTVNGAATDYLYDGDNAVQESVSGTPTANMLTGTLDELFTRRDASGTYTVLPDALGSTLALADSTGAPKTQYTYEPFGKTTATGPASSNPAQYTGRENDGTGLYFYRARYYSPTLQRFVSEDPVGFGGGDANLYAYVRNEPVRWIDPSGLEAEDSAGDASGGAGVGLGGALIFHNQDRKGRAKLGKPNRKANYGWDRSFALDYSDDLGYHLNAEFGPLRFANHTKVPKWLYKLGSTKALSRLAAGAAVIGAGLDLYDIATAGRKERPRAIGRAIGGWIGSGLGAAAGSFFAPGAGTVIGGVVGGIGGGLLGDLIGGLF
ncbi:MAG TPA: RHS repeat-associated core domain-containing protein [Pyrinomonadaceae bacterium]|nr:RHS repeat-associated core domain-containing protein [Pyrinomonadaceae bacterium]